MTTEEKPDTKTEAARPKTEAALPAPIVPATTQAFPIAKLDSDAFTLGLEPNGFAELARLAGVLAKTGIGGVKNAEDALARILAGRELGIPAMTSVRQMFVVEGRVGMEASLAHALCLRSPLCEFFEHIETTDEQATFETKRRGRPAKRHSFNVKQAEAAGLLDRGDKKNMNNWNRWLRQMLEARAKMQLARLVFPDILGGLYSREELASGVYDEPQQIEVESKVVAEAAVASAMRDYDAELTDFKAKSDAAKTKADFSALRDAIAAADWPAGHKQLATDLYSAAAKRAKEAAAKATVPAPAEAAREPGVD